MRTLIGIVVGAVSAIGAFALLGLIADAIAGPGFDCGESCGSVPPLVWACIALVAAAGGFALARVIARR